MPIFPQAYVPSILLHELVPMLSLLIGAVGCLAADAATDKEGSRRTLPWITLAAIIFAGISFFTTPLPNFPFLEKTFYADSFGQLACLTVLFSALAMVTMGPRLVKDRNLPSGEFYALLNFATFGGVVLCLSNELVTSFIALEIMSLSLYVLASLDRKSAKAAEAGFKYFILGSFASAFLVFGIAFLFGATGTTRLTEIAEVLKAGYAAAAPGIEGGSRLLNPLWIYIGFTMLFVGLSFKLALAPFHMYAPDVYEGANTPTTLFIATGSKVAAFALLVHLFATMANWPYFATYGTFLVGLLAVASMIWGNTAALAQSNFKRMMAFSSVAHTGYLSVGALVLVALPNSFSGDELVSGQLAIRNAIGLYLAGYTIMNVLAIGLAFYIGGDGSLSAYRGLFFRRPLVAFAMATAMFSLVGIGFTPPTIGFMGKFYLFKEAVQHGFILIAIIAVITSVISAFFYLSLVVTMFMREATVENGVPLIAYQATEGGALSINTGTRIILIISGILVFVLGLLPSLYTNLSELFAGSVR